MEFFPSHVFSLEQSRARPATHCDFDASPLFARSLIDAIQRQDAIKREQARAQAIQRQQAAARRAQERQARAYLEHMYQLQRQEELARRREAQRQYHLQLQRQEQIRKQQYAEYQRRKTQAIEQERRRIQAIRDAQDQSRHVFLALEDLLFGGGFTDEQQDEQPAQASTLAPTRPDIKGKQVEPEQQTAADDTMNFDADPEQVGPAEILQQEPVKAKEDVLVFTHPFPAGESSSSVSADSIQISVDEQNNKVTVSGLWDNTATLQRPSSPTSSTSSRGRSPSPKQARVSDVDENGNEIITPDQDDDAGSTSTVGDDFVKLSFAPSSKVEKNFELPNGAKAEDLRAELTDEGLKLWVSA